MERLPAVSGFFYPSSRDDLIRLLQNMEDATRQGDTCSDPIGVIVPHAGMVYSGRTAMHSYLALRKSGKRRFIIVGPNHRSFPHYAAGTSSENWITPLGKAHVDAALKQVLQGEGSVLLDEEANRTEHSVEVQIPFLQHLFGDGFTFFPIILGDQSPVAVRKLARMLNENSGDAAFIMSSDLTHYEPQDTAEKKDMELVSAIESLDIQRFYHLIMEKNITACGFGAIAILMEITRLRRGSIELLDYSTSGDTGGDRSSVVGYSSFVSCPPED